MKKILVVDDEPLVREFIVEYLGNNFGTEYELIEAENGKKAFEILDENVSVCVCDVAMPVLNGLGFLKKAKQEYPHLPVIMVTGYHGDTGQEELIGAGAKCILGKPLNMNLLIKKIKEEIK